jgi:hypothetical protein
LWILKNFKFHIFLIVNGFWTWVVGYYHLNFFTIQNYVITIVLYLVLCKINHIWHNTYSSSNIIFKNQNSKFNLMNFSFEFLNFHISHWTQLGMINITFLRKFKSICKKFIVFIIIWHGFWLLSLYSYPNELGKKFKLHIFDKSLTQTLTK